MTAKTIRPKCVLLDADIVIELHELKIWSKLIEIIEVIIPSIVVKDEALFYHERIKGIPEDINLPKLVAENKITEVAATLEEIEGLIQVFDRLFVNGMHDGESEALALLKAGKLANSCFCTGDAVAIKALAMLDMSERGISLEALLNSVGLGRKLYKIQFTEDYFKQNIQRGGKNKITGEGLAHKS